MTELALPLLLVTPHSSDNVPPDVLRDTSGNALGSAPSVSPEGALNDPQRADEISFRYSRPERAVPVPGFGFGVNRVLYPTRLGVCEMKVQVLQQALAAFSHDALTIVRAHPLGVQG